LDNKVFHIIDARCNHEEASTNFPKIQEPLQNSKRRKGYKEYVRHHLIQFSCLVDLSWIGAPQKYRGIKENALADWRWIVASSVPPTRCM